MWNGRKVSGGGTNATTATDLPPPTAFVETFFINSPINISDISGLTHKFYFHEGFFGWYLKKKKMDSVWTLRTTRRLHFNIIIIIINDDNDDKHTQDKKKKQKVGGR